PFIGNTGGGEAEAGTGDRWEWTLGLAQFNWLRQTLENSDAAYKFIFAHHMTGGSDDYVRKGAYGAPYCEWGGYNENGTTWGFDSRRNGWYCTVHQLFVENNVSAFFHGHDHQYAYEILDGVVYQSCAAAGFTGNGFNLYSEANAYTVKVMPSSGHLRVTVTPAQATVDYVRSGGTGGAYSYTIAPNAPIAVQLSSCSARRAEDGVVAVHWQTASEVNTAGFYVQRSETQEHGFARIHDRMIAAKGNSSDGAVYQFIDSNSPKQDCYYRLEEVNLDGASFYFEPVSLSLGSAVDSETLAPLTFALLQNYPNPFNPITKILYSIPTSEQVTLNIYDLNGRLVKQLVDQQQQEGRHCVTWDGSNDHGQHVGSGTYFYRLSAGDLTAVQKMVFLK
ncbi:T9SS C-terminal target domain-containing protein, partial [candidate division KSB1 bacterium]